MSQGLPFERGMRARRARSTSGERTRKRRERRVGHRARGAVLVDALQDASIPSFASMGLQLSSELRGLSISSAASNDARAESPCTAAP
jgi:hypothetical protein